MLQCVDDGPNWSHQPNAGAESGLAATVATGQYMGSIWKVSIWETCIYRKVYGELYGKGIIDIVYGKVYRKVDDGPNWSHQPNAGEESGLWPLD